MQVVSISVCPIYHAVRSKWFKRGGGGMCRYIKCPDSKYLILRTCPARYNPGVLDRLGRRNTSNVMYPVCTGTANRVRVVPGERAHRMK